MLFLHLGKKGAIMDKKLTAVLFFLVIIFAHGYGEEETARVKYIPGSSVQIRAVASALNYIGTPYRLGGSDSQGLDCSGLIYVSFRDLTGFPLPRRTEDLYTVGTIPEGPLMPGDLVFFATADGSSHVGIFLEDSFFIHSASEGPGIGVIVSSLKDPYYRDRYIGARRVLDWSMPVFEIIPGKSATVIGHTRKIYKGTPLGFRIISPYDYQSTWNLSLVWNNEPHIKKRMTLKPKGNGFFWYYTRPGQWTAVIQDGDGMKAVSLNYYVEESEDNN
jgi:probable lipoprotein NlpC